MADLKAPVKKDLVGILLSAEEVNTKSGDIVVINIQDVEDEIVTMSCSPNYWKKIGKLFPVDSVVKASYEVRIKDITGYEKDAAMVAHTSDGNSLIGINRFSALAFQRMLDKQDMTEGVAIISSVEVDRVAAVSQYLSSFVRK